jgi:DNA-binding MarR family transcriptional regulator
VSAGYVRRANSRHDRRRTRLELTASGERLLRRATKVRRELLAEVTEGWSEADLSVLGGLLARLNLELLRLEEGGT